MNDEHNKKINSKILDAIREGKVKMRPRWHFVLSSILLVVGSLLVFLALLYLVSLMAFMLRDTGLMFIPGFGIGGWVELLRSLPWVIVMLVLVFVVVLFLLVKHYRFAYRQPLIYSIVMLLLLITFGSLVLDQMGMQSRMHRYYREHNRPSPIDGVYKMLRSERYERVHPGEIIVVSENGFIIHEKMGGGTTSVIISDETFFPDGNEFAPGVRVVVLGQRVFEMGSGTIRAVGVGKPPQFKNAPFFMPPSEVR